MSTAHIGDVLIRTTTIPGGALSRARTKVRALTANRTALNISRVPFPLKTRVILAEGNAIATPINRIAGTKFRIVAAATGGVSSSPITVDRNPAAQRNDVATPRPMPM